MSAAFWVSPVRVVGEYVGGESCGNGVNVLDGGGLLSDFVACCLFLSYFGRQLSETARVRALRKEYEQGLWRGQPLLSCPQLQTSGGGEGSR